jgi:choline dehydrogenase
MKRGYDYIVLGGGSAGCVLANRLSADPACDVLLVEAGPRDWDPLIRVPLMAGQFYRHTLHNWCYLTEPEPHLNNRRIEWPRGRVLGGSSAINGMVYTRGNKYDYDQWAQLGLRDWSYENLLPFFRKFEDFRDGENAYHGTGGELPVTRPNTPHPFYDTFEQAGLQSGLKFNPDFNGEEQEGVGRYHSSIGDGERWSTARAFLDPVRDRRNLDIVTGASVLKVDIANGRAFGVDLIANGLRTNITASREVIVSCGTISSPTVLMHSGIGPQRDLRALGIDVKVDTKGVGQNLQDHANVRMQYSSKREDALFGLRRFDRAALALARAVLLRSGPATKFPLEAGAFLRSRPELAAPDLQMHFTPGISTANLRYPFRRLPAGAYEGYGFSGNVCHLRPESRGHIKLKSADPLDRPAIHVNYLATEGDRLSMREGFKRLRGMFHQKAFDDIRGEEVWPGPKVKTDDDIDAFIRANAASIYHPVGTCRMGVDDDSVVDEQLRVRGVDGLRVIDASIMPNLISANTNAPTIMIAEKGADYILRAH